MEMNLRPLSIDLDSNHPFAGHHQHRNGPRAPKVRVVAFGYYLIIAHKTPKDVKLTALLHLGPSGVTASVAEELDKNYGDALRAAPAFKQELRGGMADRWAHFVRARHEIRDAVSAFRQRWMAGEMVYS